MANSCVCVHACAHTHVCACMWRPESNFSCHSSGAIYLRFFGDKISHWLGACLFFFKIFFFFFVCVGICLQICICEGAISPGTVIADSCELPHGCWEWNLGLLEEHLVLLTCEPLLQPPAWNLPSRLD